MAQLSVGQAVRNAIAAELAAATFYKRLGEQTEDAAAKRFLANMALAEEAHARDIEKMASRLTAELPVNADRLACVMETAPGWEWAEDVSLQEALQIALEAEHSAALFYGAVADALQGDGKQFFEGLAATEAEHARLISEHLVA